MTPQRVTLITLGVADLTAACAFDGRLGWIEQSGTEGVAFYQRHGAVLGRFGRDDLAKVQRRAGATLGTGAVTSAQNFATDAEVDAEAIAAGGTALKAPEKVFWRGYSSYWADSDGHVWDLAMNPFRPLAEDGSLTLAHAG